MLCSKISFERISTPAKELIHTTTTLKNTQNPHWVSVSAVRSALAGVLLFCYYSDVFVALFILLSYIWRCSTNYWQENSVSAEARMYFLLLHLFLWGFGFGDCASLHSDIPLEAKACTQCHSQPGSQLGSQASGERGNGNLCLLLLHALVGLGSPI